VYKTRTEPWPVAGGVAGRPNRIVLNPGTDREVVQGGSYNRLDTDEVLVNDTGGGGGFGDPLTRDPTRVAQDVRNGFVSVEAAARDYGVVVHPDTYDVDVAATNRARSQGLRPTPA
jgi:N-methylhydantoinase B